MPDAQADPWHVMIYADGLPAPGQYTLRTDFYEGIFLTSLTPTRHGNSNVAVVDMQAGTTSSVPIYMLSTVELTNLSFTVV